MTDASANAVAVISAIAALCAVVLGPLVSLWAARRQSRVSVLSSNRQAWINSLREQVAEFIALAGYMSLDTDKVSLRERAEKMLFIEAKVRLLLNPKEADHQQLMDAMHKLRKAASSTIQSADPAHHANLANATAVIVPIAQAILKREWERVKNVS
jgi:hypothetical protein